MLNVNDTIDESVIKEIKQGIMLILFSEEDASNIFLEIHSGAGGSDAQNWALMIMDMYIKWINKLKLTYSIIDITKSNDGLKSSTILVTGKNFPYGYLKNENGVHRLVRISPFNSSGKRHTSFASVSIYKKYDNVDIEINECDLKIDTFRSSGAGGQHVNTTDSAVRITHIPTGVVVQCQSERSQHQNKNTALIMMRNKLKFLEEEKQQEKKRNEYQTKSNIEWGSQIRSYTLHPYSSVVDKRLSESYNPETILNGDLYDIVLNLLKISL